MLRFARQSRRFPAEITVARRHASPNRDHECAQGYPHEFDVGDRQGDVTGYHDTAREDTIKKVDESHVRMGRPGDHFPSSER